MQHSGPNSRLAHSATRTIHQREGISLPEASHTLFEASFEFFISLKLTKHQRVRHTTSASVYISSPHLADTYVKDIMQFNTLQHHRERDQ